jgi:hypothetical protein
MVHVLIFHVPVDPPIVPLSCYTYILFGGPTYGLCHFVSPAHSAPDFHVSFCLTLFLKGLTLCDTILAVWKKLL